LEVNLTVPLQGAAIAELLRSEPEVGLQKVMVALRVMAEVGGQRPGDGGQCSEDGGQCSGDLGRSAQCGLMQVKLL
jgi:hypothetical protein